MQWFYQKVVVGLAAYAPSVRVAVLCVALPALGQVPFTPVCSVCEKTRQLDFLLLISALACFFVLYNAGAAEWVTSAEEFIPGKRRRRQSNGRQDGCRWVAPNWLHDPHRGTRVAPEKQPPSHGNSKGSGDQAGNHYLRQKPDMLIVGRARTDGVPPKASRVGRMMHACVRLGSVDAALTLFDQMLESGAAPDAHLVGKPVSDKFFKLVADNLDAQRLRADGLGLLDLIQAHGLAPSIATQNRLVVAWRSKLPESVLDYFLKMKSSGFTISRIAYHSILMAAERSDPRTALSMFAEMEKSGIKPDGVAFNAVMGACSQLGMSDEARQLFMQMTGRALVPDQKSYCIMLKVYASSNQLKQAMALWETMRGQCLEPDRYSYHHAICSCISLQRIEYAVELYNDMLQAKLSPCDGTRTYLRAACRNFGWNSRAVYLMMGDELSR